MPIAGMAFLGWRATSMLFVFYVDWFVWFAGSVLSGHLEEEDPANNILEIIIAVCVFGAIWGFPIVFWSRGEIELDRSLALACLAQALFSAQSFLKARRELQARLRVEFSERRRQAARQQRDIPLRISIIRWFAVILAGVASPIGMVVVYIAVTVYFELWRPAFLYSGE